MGIWSSGITVVALFCLILVAHAQENPVEVDISSGKIRGFESTFLGSQVRSFLGVPFAEPPIGENRFKPPVPKSAWTDTLDATKPSPACYQ
ncbi:unnamed protein product, partial [Anisakis simplex]|uniref:COesterase domain-containing protein n=1 Tax=Anisakis simplex TaxID=6269 RepID=A0A0M3J189_ANISI